MSPTFLELHSSSAVVTEPRRDAHADERQATDAAAQATVTINFPSSTPTAVEGLSSAVDTGAKVVSEPQPFENT